MKLNAKQRRYYDKLIQRQTGKYLITGHAGTGKTTLAIELIKGYIKARKSVLVLCPTHQAKQQFTSKLEDIVGVELGTVAKWLYQFPVKDKETGKLVFMPGSDLNSDHDVVIIDETSMVSEFEMRLIFQNRRDRLTLFLGDFEQLRPVMKKQGDLYKHLPTLTLTQQQRNANTILKLCSETRDRIVFPRKSTNDITVHRERDAMIEHFLDDLVNADVPYNVCFLAYRNRVVDVVRAKAHLALYGKAPFNVGQYMRLDAMCIVGNNGALVKILKVIDKDRKTIAGIHAMVYTLKLKNIDTYERGVVEIVAPNNQLLLKKRREELYIESGNAFKRDKMTWEWCQEQLKDINDLCFVSSPFVQTVHKSQGRSIPRVYVDTQDIHAGNDRKKLLYVAYSRAMHELHTIRIREGESR